MIDRQIVKSLYLSGASLNEISKKYNCSRQYIHQEIIKMNIHRDRVNKLAWMNDEIVLESIKKYRFEDGLAWKQIAKKLNIPIHQIYKFNTKDYPIFNNLKRRCGKCNEVLPLDNFHNVKTGYLGKMSICKACNYRNVIKYYKIRKAKNS